jgi:hypothetical protein
VQFGGERVNLAGQLRVGFELQLLFLEVVVGFGLLECRLPVLADHDKRGEEDRFQRDDQRQHRPWLGLDEEHPNGEEADVKVNEVHRPREGGDSVGDPQLNVLATLRLLCQDNRVVAGFPRVRRARLIAGSGRLTVRAAGELSALLRLRTGSHTVRVFRAQVRLCHLWCLSFLVPPPAALRVRHPPSPSEGLADAHRGDVSYRRLPPRLRLRLHLAKPGAGSARSGASGRPARSPTLRRSG